MSLLLAGAGACLDGVSTTIGVGSDPLASVVNQGIGAKSTNGNLSLMYHRIPILVKCANGDFLLFYDAHTDTNDNSGYAIFAVRSTDRGVTWGSPITVYNHSTFTAASEWIASGSVIVDTINNPGNIFFFFTKATGGSPPTAHTIYYVKSTDHGANWGSAQDITANVKVAGGGATPAGQLFGATNWTFCVPTCTAGIQIQNGANRGRMLVPFDHRTVDFTGTTSWSHVIKSDDDGTTWGLFTTGGGGGLAQNGTNQGSNECSICETATTDRLVMHIRNIVAGSPRYQSVSTDCGATWSDWAALTNLECGVGSGTSSDVKQCGPYTFAAYSGDIAHSERCTLFMAYSTDQGATWPLAQARVPLCGNYAGYCSMMVDGNDLFVAYESGYGNTSASPASNISLLSTHSIKLIRTSSTYIRNSTKSAYSQWFFSEEASGVAAQTVGGQIIDYGTLGVNCSAGTAAVPPNYSSSGLVLTSGGADKIILAQASDTVFDMKATDSITVEVEATLTASTNGVLAGKFSGSSGWQFEVNAGKLKATIGDGTLTPSVTGSTTVNGGGQRKVYAFTRSVAADQIQVYIDGVADATAVTDTTTASLLNASVPCIAGDNNAGTLSIDATIHSIKITRGVAQTLLSGTQTKNTIDVFRNLTDTQLTFPAIITAPKLWMFRTSDNGRSSFADLYCSERYRMPLVAGDAFRSMRDGSSKRRRFYGSDSVRMLYAVNGYMGPCYDFDLTSATSNAVMSDPNCYGDSVKGIDFVQETGTFTIAFCINIKASTSVYQVIASNNDASGTGAGFYIIRTDGASSKLTLLVADGTAAHFNETIATAPAISYGSTYFVAFCGTGNGTGKKVLEYVIPITNAYSSSSPVQPAAASSNVYTSSADFTATTGLGTYPTGSSNYLYLGRRAAANNCMDGYIKNFMVFDYQLNTTQLDALALFNVSG